MRAIAVLAIAFQISWIAPAVRAETNVKAEDCSSAVSGTMIGSHIEVHCLSKEDIARVVDELVRQGVVKRAQDAGIETSVIVSLAARLKPTQKLDFAQAVVEVSHAVDVAMTVVAEGSSGSNDQLVDDVLKRIAERTKANDAAGATREAEEGFARWQQQEGERRAGASAAGIALLEAALNTDLLRFDAAAAAGRIEKISSLQHENDPKATFEAVHASWDQFANEGEDKGANFSLEVAIAIARREAALAQDPNQRGAALNDLGIGLGELGERESGGARLEEAVKTLRAALNELTPERAPLDWAMTQDSLGNALSALGERERATPRLKDAVHAYRAALRERTRERVPLLWARTQNNLGNALRRLGENESGTADLKEAVRAYRLALDEYDRERVPLDWATAENNLGAVLFTVGEREGAPAQLEEAVHAFRAALEHRPRQEVPLQWATTQNNLGSALSSLGQEESGAEKLEEAVKAYRLALEEYRREQVPLDWAATQNNLGNALLALGERASGTAQLEDSVQAFGEALRERTRERDPIDWAKSLGNQGVAMVLIADRTNNGPLAETALGQIEAAYKTARSARPQQWAATLEAELPAARAIRDRLKSK